MASLLEPFSNTKVHDHGCRAPRNSLSSTIVSNDSYGDLWGENSFQSSIESKRPDVIHESTAEKRWSGDGKAVSPQMDDFLSPPIKAPLNDEVSPASTITAINKEMRKIESKRRQRRGSNDMMPIRPDRRDSVNAANVSKADLSELLKLDDKQDAHNLPEKLDNYLEETKIADSDLSSPEPLSSPVVAPLNDEVDVNAIITPVMEVLPGDRLSGIGHRRRGSNDLMPIMPNRRSSVKTRVIGKLDLVDLVKLEDEEPQLRGK